MAASDPSERGPFAQPGFIAAAITVALLVVIAGVVLLANALGGDNGNDTAAPTPRTATATTPPPSPSSSPVPSEESDDSICGLPGVDLTGTVTTAPETTWEYLDVFAYPTSVSAGPGELAPEGYLRCYQHTPTGALFAAGGTATAALAVSDREAWFSYLASEGDYRDELIESATLTEPANDLRASIVGFRMLAYDGESARVDIAMQASRDGEQVPLSFVCELVWSQGDWRLNAEIPEPARTDVIPDFSGYTPWSEA